MHNYGLEKMRRGRRGGGYDLGGLRLGFVSLRNEREGEEIEIKVCGFTKLRGKEI